MPPPNQPPPRRRGRPVSPPAADHPPATTAGRRGAGGIDDIPSGGERIAKVLARAGVASRRDAEQMIRDGRVQVNDEVLVSPARAVTPADRILVDDQPLAAPEPPRLWLYHKPAGLVTTARDEQGRPTVFERLPPGLPRVMTVGRLDLSSEGLLLLTNDGELKRQLELPSTGWLRRYRVRVNGRPEDGIFAPLRAGIVIAGERFQPMEVRIDRQQGANAWLTVGIREGRNREVRRAMAEVGLQVNRLIRVGYGPFQLGDLAPGAVLEVRPRILRDQLGAMLPAAPARAGTTGGEGGRRGPAGKPASHLATAARTGSGPGPGPKGARRTDVAPGATRPQAPAAPPSAASMTSGLQRGGARISAPPTTSGDDPRPAAEATGRKRVSGQAGGGAGRDTTDRPAGRGKDTGGSPTDNGKAGAGRPPRATPRTPPAKGGGRHR